MMMPGREYQAQPSRFGFNGKENDNEVKGFGNQQDYGMRIYDGRIAKFLSVDPLGKTFPWYTPYQFAGNTPIQAIDLDGGEPFYMEQRGFSIKWYYESFNAISGSKRNPFGNGFSNNILREPRKLFNTLFQDPNKFGDDAIDRLRAFATDNQNQYMIHRNTGSDNRVFHNSRKLGYYDCVTSQEASLQIIKNNYSIQLLDGGNAQLSGQKWEKEGHVASAMTFTATRMAQKNRGDVVTQSDFELDFPISSNLENAAGRTVGTTFFTFEMGKDFHGGIVGVTTSYNAEGKLSSSFFYADQTKGFVEFGTEGAFNRYFEYYMFINTTTVNEETGERRFNPGDNGARISQGNEKVVFRKINK